MNAIRIHKVIDSETLHLPELKPLIGKAVEIIVLEEQAANQALTTDAWADAARAVRELKDYDFDAWREQREFDRRHAEDHLP
jgi:hypothetical protein